jgi:hypothetical protein
MYWDNPVKHDRPLITNCHVPGLALACGLSPSSATEERDLDMLLANIALADQEGRPLSFSRNKNHAYRGITSDRVLSGVAKIVPDLALERRTKPGQRGWQSDLRGTSELTRIFDRHGEEPAYGPSEPIILRSRRDGSLLPLKPMRDRQRQAERVNEMLLGTLLGLEMTGAIRLQNNLWLFERLEEDQFGNPRLMQQRLRLDRMEGRRIFTRDLQHHGRFYCPAQNIPSVARLQCTLNSDQVVELDFCSMHVALAHALCGATMTGDPYEIPGFTRKQAKLGLLTAFNAISIQAAIASLTDARAGRPVFTSRKEAARLIETLKTRHAPIASMLCSDAGMTLMNLDSRIMMNAVDWLISRGIPCVPIHDSIMVQAQYEGEARAALNFGWYSQKLSLTLCNIEKKSQKPLQYGGECAVGVGVAPSGPCPDRLLPGIGWWSAVLSEARFDVVEWCSQ